MKSSAEWDNELPSRMFFKRHAGCETAECPNARFAIGKNPGAAPVYDTDFQFRHGFVLCQATRTWPLGTEMS